MLAGWPWWVGGVRFAAFVAWFTEDAFDAYVPRSLHLSVAFVAFHFPAIPFLLPCLAIAFLSTLLPFYFCMALFRFVPHNIFSLLARPAVSVATC